MQGLMLKLANVDAAGERALRVVAYFDQLAGNSPDLDAIVRATAVIADCTAGLQLRRSGQLLRYSRDGELLVGATGAPSEVRELDGNDEDGTVWLEREGAARELDEFIVERFSLTVGGLLRRQQAIGHLDTTSGFSDPALAQVLVNARASEPERSRAARLIGLQPASSIQLLAFEPDDGSTTEAVVPELRSCWQRQILAAELSRHLSLLIVVGPEPVRLEDMTVAGRIGAGPVVDTLDAPRSWGAARETLRFAGAGVAWPRALDSGRLGALRLLAQLDPDSVAGNPDVAAVALIASQPSGREALDVLDHFLHAGSLREAARATNYHHSSLQTRVLRLGKQLGIDLMTPAGRQRAGLALLLWRSAG